jgi:hypothetical protein
MANAERQMPVHVEAAYKEAVDNTMFLNRQQWMATNYALLVYAAIFVISAQFFQRTDFARNSLGIVAIVTFFIHWYMMFIFQHAIDRFRARLLDLQNLLQRRRAAWLGFTDPARTVLGPMARCCWVCPCLIRRLCFDRDLFVVSPLNWSAVRMGSPLRFPSSRDVYPACVRLLTRRGIGLDQPLSVRR